MQRNASPSKIELSAPSVRRERDQEAEKKPSFDSTPKSYRSGGNDSEFSSKLSQNERNGNDAKAPLSPVYRIIQLPKDDFLSVVRTSGFPVAIGTPIVANMQDIPYSNSVPFTGSGNIAIPSPSFPPPQGGIGAGGLPSGLPSPVLPNTPPAGFSGSAAPAMPAYPGTNLGGAVPNVVAPPATAYPGTGIPGVPNSLPIVSNPLPNMPGMATSPPTTMTGPPAFYQTNPSVMPGPPSMGAPPMARSPSDGGMPLYPRGATTMNSQPFVSPGPCQFDASYMVSPRVYRQSLDACQPTCSSGSPMSYGPGTGGSPFSYVPPTYMPQPYSRSPYRPLIGLGQDLSRAYIGRGVVGQPVAYMDGQPVRNLFRYLLP
jgi:hypothetical protein